VPGVDVPGELLQPSAALIAAASVRPTSLWAGVIVVLSCRFM
jgi:hypothetical protein